MSRFRDLPIISRWMVSALGSVDPQRSLKPLDPVAAWLLREHPDLRPTSAAPSLACTLRARASAIDALLEEEAAAAAASGHQLALWTLGGGLDARWYRLRKTLRPVLAEILEMDQPAVVELKQRMLEASPYADAWRAVEARGVPELNWHITPTTRADRVVVVLEALAGRWESDRLAALLDALRATVPRVRVVASIPGKTETDRDTWSLGNLYRRGWRVANDQRVAPRGRLIAPGGHEICPGMYPFRVVVLEGRSAAR